MKAKNRLSKAGREAIARAARLRWRKYKTAIRRGDRRTARKILGRRMAR